MSRISKNRQVRTWSASILKSVAHRQEWCCKHCRAMLPPSFQIDHVVPLWAGGEDCHETNAEALCPTCHATKTQKENLQRTLTRQKIIQDATSKRHTESRTLTLISRPVRPLGPTDCILELQNNPFIHFAYGGRPRWTQKRGFTT